MTSSLDNRHVFFEVLERAFRDGHVVKATLSQASPETRWKRIVIRAFTNSCGELQLGFDYFDGRQSERRNLSPQEGIDEVKRWLPEQLRTANVHLVGEELIFEATTSGSFRLKRRPNTTSIAPSPSHNREKRYLIPADSPFLIELGISDPSGVVRRERYDKFRQIQKFVEILAELVETELTAGSRGLSVVDFGSGKHYLTFALHAFLASRLEHPHVMGVEQRADLVAVGRSIASSLQLPGIDFVEGTISSCALDSVDLVVALHACNTATDDAIAKAVRAKARYICVAPCCHSFVRQHFTPSRELHAMLRHGIVQERFAEGLTDSLRVLVLEALGYQAKLFEFISPDHTAKNLMITATYTGQRSSSSAQSFRDLKTMFALPNFYLDAILEDLL